MCVCLCVCVREREREKQKRVRERARERARVRKSHSNKEFRKHAKMLIIEYIKNIVLAKRCTGFVSVKKFHFCLETAKPRAVLLRLADD